MNDQRVDEDPGERRRFSSRILPAYARRSPKVNDVLEESAGGDGNVASRVLTLL